VELRAAKVSGNDDLPYALLKGGVLVARRNLAFGFNDPFLSIQGVSNPDISFTFHLVGWIGRASSECEVFAHGPLDRIFAEPAPLTGRTVIITIGTVGKRQSSGILLVMLVVGEGWHHRYSLQAYGWGVRRVTIACAEAGQAVVHSAEECSAAGTSSRGIGVKPKRGKKSRAVSVSR